MYNVVKRCHYSYNDGMSKLSKATKAYRNKQKYTAEYVKRAYHRIGLNVMHSEYDIIKSAADNAGLPVNTYIKRAIASAIKNDGGDVIEKWL